MAAGKTQGGFTLIEIVMILVVMGILFGLVSTSVRVLEAPDNVLYEEKLKMLVRVVHARNEAMLLGRQTSFDVDETSVTYTDMTPVQGEETDRTQAYFAPGVTVVEGTGVWRFTDEGMCLSPGKLTLQKDGETVSMTVTGGGYVQ